MLGALHAFRSCKRRKSHCSTKKNLSLRSFKVRFSDGGADGWLVLNGGADGWLVFPVPGLASHVSNTLRYYGLTSLRCDHHMHHNANDSSVVIAQSSVASFIYHLKMNRSVSSSLLGSLMRHRRISSPETRRNFLDFLQSKNLENTGSVARDLLAAERTFLAWARTGLGFVGAGSAMFAAYHEVSAPSGIRTEVILPSGVLIANGTFLLLFATRRYVKVCQALQSNTFPLDTRGTFFAIGVTALGTVTSLGLVLNTELNKKTNPSSSDSST